MIDFNLPLGLPESYSGRAGLAIGLIWITFELYKFTFHPLARFPGPKWWVISRLPFILSFRGGRLPHDLSRLHARYGPVVRVAWDELSFADAAAWQDIHGSAALRKDMRWYAAAGGTKGTAVADANNADYARIRRAILAGMSDKALREQEVLLQKYVNKLMAVIGNEARNGGARNLELSRLIDYTLFDLFGDLSLGESFGCLDSNDYHPFVKGLVGMGEGLAWLISSRFIPGAEWLLWKLTPKSVRDARDNHLAYSRTQIRKRLELGESPDHPDFVTFMIQDKASESIPLESIEGTFTLLVVAGSETTSTCITAIIRELARYPEKQERLAREVCGRFATADEITVSAIKSLPFLNACIDEGLRLCPPAPLGPRRVTPPEGAIIAGQFIPGKMTVSVAQYTVSTSEQYFTNACQYHPERWEKTSEDMKHNPRAYNPFVMNGYRGCLGRTLAYAEMRLILAKLVMSYKWTDRSGSWDWRDQKAFLMWQKNPVIVDLKIRGS